MNAAALADLEERYAAACRRSYQTGLAVIEHDTARNRAAKRIADAEYGPTRDAYWEALKSAPPGRWPCCRECGTTEELAAMPPAGYLCVQCLPCPSADPGV